MVAVLIAVIGVHGVSAYRARRRRVEIGVRVALGADRGQIFWLLARRSLLAAAVGGVAGHAVARAASSLLAGYLFEVSPLDPLTLVAATVLLMAVTAAAATAPSRRGARMDPSLALRDE